MGLNSKVFIVFPYKMSALLNAMGMIWNFTKGHSNPIENGPGTPGSLWEWYGIIAHIKTMGNIWNFTKYIAVPYECSVIIWYQYGTDPISFPYQILWWMYGTLRNT